MGSKILAVFAATGMFFTPQIVEAQNYPNKPVRIMVGFSAGGSTDVLARVAAQEARKHLGQELIIVNKPGAAATIAMAEVANADPDGYTIGITPSGVMTMTPLFQNVRQDLLDETAALVVAGRQRTGLTVRSDSPIRNVKDLLAAAKAKPGTVSIGTPGVGTGVAVLLQAIIMQEKSDINLVPMQGDAPRGASVDGRARFCWHDLGGRVRRTDSRRHVSPDRLNGQ